METQLKAARQAHGWSQLRVITELIALGEHRHVPMPTRESLKTQISRWENGHVVPQEPYRTMLAEIFGVTPVELGLDDPLARIEPLQLSRESIRSMRALLGQFVQVDNTVGPQQLMKLVTQQVSTLEPMLIGARGQVRQGGWRLGSQFAEFAGWPGQDAGDLDAAERWSNLAMDFAEEVDDPEIRAYVLMRKSGIATERHERGRALTLASASCHDLERLSPRVRALSLRQAAISQALVGDRRRSERAAQLAVEAALEANGRGSGFPHVGYMTPAYVLMESGVSAYHLRRYDAAVSRLSNALQNGVADFPATTASALCTVGGKPVNPLRADRISRPVTRAAARARARPVNTAVTGFRRRYRWTARLPTVWLFMTRHCATRIEPKASPGAPAAERKKNARTNRPRRSPDL